MKASGGCLCGQLRYEIDGDDPMWTGCCYCSDCQKETGAGHLTAIAVAASDIQTSGKLSTFSKIGDSGGEVIRSFCPECGTTIFGRPVVMGEMRVVRAGTLDDSSSVKPERAVYCSRAASWDQPLDGVMQFAEMPPRG